MYSEYRSNKEAEEKLEVEEIAVMLVAKEATTMGENWKNVQLVEQQADQLGKWLNHNSLDPKHVVLSFFEERQVGVNLVSSSCSNCLKPVVVVRGIKSKNYYYLLCLYTCIETVATACNW